MRIAPAGTAARARPTPVVAASVAPAETAIALLRDIPCIFSPSDNTRRRRRDGRHTLHLRKATSPEGDGANGMRQEKSPRA